MKNSPTPSTGKVRTYLTIDPVLHDRARKHCDARYRSFSATVEMCLTYYLDAIDADPAAEIQFTKEVEAAI